MQNFLRKTKLTFITLLILVFSSYFLNSQPPRAKERINQLKKIKLLEILELDEKTSEKFLAKYTAYEKKIDDQRVVIDNASEDLESSLRKSASKDELAQKSQKLIQEQEKFHSIFIEKLKTMKEILNDEEYAKFLVFEDRFPKELQKILQKRMRNRGFRDQEK